MDAKYQTTRFIFVIGIGGSDLASKAIWNALTLHKPEIDKKIFFLESPDSREYQEIEDLIKNKIQTKEQLALIAVSKSGETLETLETFNRVFGIFSDKFGPAINERVTVISSEGSSLWNLAQEKGIESIAWQENIGGRFSAFTVAHTKVLSLAGLDVEAFMSGGKMMGEILDLETAKNPAKNLAEKIFDNYKVGKDIIDLFFFNSELEDLGKWCRQLIAESLGKENKRGQKVGITPTVSIGPTDLHSMLQLALGGPQTRFTLFIRSQREIAQSLNEATYESALETYKDAGLPFEKYEMPEINEFELGKFMVFMMGVVLELADLLEVDPYGQPAVEEYKKHLTPND